MPFLDHDYSVCSLVLFSSFFVLNVHRFGTVHVEDAIKFRRLLAGFDYASVDGRFIVSYVKRLAL